MASLKRVTSSLRITEPGDSAHMRSTAARMARYSATRLEMLKPLCARCTAWVPAGDLGWPASAGARPSAFSMDSARVCGVRMSATIAWMISGRWSRSSSSDISWPLCSERAKVTACSTMSSAWASMKSASPLCTCLPPRECWGKCYDILRGFQRAAAGDWSAPAPCGILPAYGGRTIWSLAMDALATALAPLAPGPTQHQRLLRPHTRPVRDALRSQTLIGHGSLDVGGFRLALTALAFHPRLSLNELLGAPALLELL